MRSVRESAVSETKVQHFVNEDDKEETTWEQRRAQRIALRNMFLKAMKESTLHGIRYIFDPEAIILRRILWFLIVCICAGFFTFQLYTRGTNFISSPKVVNLEVVYKKSLRFPEVIMCNQNMFKVTHLSPGAFSAVMNFFSKSPDQVTTETAKLVAAIDEQKKQFSGTYVNLTEETLDNRHFLEDMLVKGKPCSPANFSMITTDFGFCYQFVSDEETLDVPNPGVGLSMLINVEQYAYGYAKRSSAGLQLFFKIPEEIPTLDDFGLLVPAGGQTLIGLEVSQMNDLSRPYGQCDSKPLKHFSTYSRSNCRLECVTNFIYSTCNCKGYTLPGDLPVCSMTNYYNCSYPLRAKFSEMKESESCDCPPACDEITYNPTATFAPYSEFAAELLAADARSGTRGLALLRDIITTKDIITVNMNQELSGRDLGMLLKAVGVPLTTYVLQVQPIYVLIDQVKQALFDADKNWIDSSDTSLRQELAATLGLLNDLNQKLRSVDPSCYSPIAYRLNKGAEMNGTYTFLSWTLGSLGRTQAFQTLGPQGQNASTFADLQFNALSTMTMINATITEIIDSISKSVINGSVKRFEENFKNISSNVATLHIAIVDSLQPLFREIQTGLFNVGKYSNETVPVLDLSIIDKTFVRENLIKLDIFFKELRITTISKQLSDSLVSLVCDIGGSLGLWLGASIISMYELFDFIICMIHLRFASNQSR